MPGSMLFSYTGNFKATGTLWSPTDAIRDVLLYSKTSFI